MAYFSEHICSGFAKDMGAAEKTTVRPKEEKMQKFHTTTAWRGFALSPDEKGEGETICLRSLVSYDVAHIRRVTAVLNEKQKAI